jgi:hypothetical protein
VNKRMTWILSLCLAALLLIPAAIDVQAMSKSKQVEEGAAEETAIRHEVAFFAVEGLDMEQAGKLAEVLSELPGVMAAKPVLEEKKLAVVFAAPESDPEIILAAMEKAGADAELIEVKPIEGKAGEKSACDGCPSKSKCGKGDGSS